MAKLDNYRAYIQTLLTKYSQIGNPDDEVKTEIIFDTERDSYLLFHVGWQKNRRIYGCVLHIDIRDSKIWIQHNGTEIAIADELVALGVSKQDIVLGFQSPYKRQFTEFAVG